ncbi:MAG: hypothetical protein RLY86_3989 [Pseudomonadota bacterium]|jgi:voltage-gated potassium channel
MLAHLFRRRRPPCYIREADIGRSLVRLGFWLLAVCTAHVAAMVLLEGMALRDAAWLTATTIVTVGYGDQFAKTDAGRLATVVLMYGGGIFVLATLVGVLTDWRADTIERKATGAWDWKTMKNHLLLVGEPSGDAVQHVARLIDQIREHEDWIGTPVVMLTRAFERIPNSLADRGVVHVAGSAADAAALARTHPETARMALVFARSQSDPDADPAVLYAVDRLREANPALSILAELVREEDRQRITARDPGVEAIRPMHGYPEMAARSLVSPGASALIENLFTAHGEECRRYDLPRVWTGNWTDLLVTLASRGIGTAVGCRTEEGAILANPLGRQVATRSLYVVVGDRVQVDAGRLITAALAAPRGT